MSPATRAHRTAPEGPPRGYPLLLAAAAVTEVRGNPGPGQAVETRHEQYQRISRTLLEAAGELAHPNTRKGH